MIPVSLIPVTVPSPKQYDLLNCLKCRHQSHATSIVTSSTYTCEFGYLYSESHKRILSKVDTLLQAVISLCKENAWESEAARWTKS